jgi:bacterial/archaeal transporter family protein
VGASVWMPSGGGIHVHAYDIAKDLGRGREAGGRGRSKYIIARSGWQRGPEMSEEDSVAILFTLVSVAIYGIWGTLGKRALQELSWQQVSFFYGLGIVLLLGVLLVASEHRSSWTLHGVLFGSLTGLLGALGLVALYLALDRGKASVVFPLFGLFPVVTAVLSAIFLDERLSTIQYAGIGCAVLATALISLG